MSRLKSLDSLIQEAAKKIKKYRDENRRLSSDLKAAQAEVARLGAQVREQQGLQARHQKVRVRLERLLETLEKVELKAAAEPAPQDGAAGGQ